MHVGVVTSGLNAWAQNELCSEDGQCGEIWTSKPIRCCLVSKLVRKNFSRSMTLCGSTSFEGASQSRMPLVERLELGNRLGSDWPI